MPEKLILCSCSRVLLSALLKAHRMKALIKQLVYMVIYFAHEMQYFFPRSIFSSFNFGS